MRFQRFTIFLLILFLLTACSTIQEISTGDEPVALGEIPVNTLRVHYTRHDGLYEDMVLWIWNDTTWSDVGGWPNGMEQTGQSPYGVYWDVPLKENPQDVGFLAVDKTVGDAGKDGGDKRFTLAGMYNEVWIRQGDDTVYLNSDYIVEQRIVAARVVSEAAIEASFTTTEGISLDDALNNLILIDRHGERIVPDRVRVVHARNAIEFRFPVDVDAAPYSLTYEEISVTANVGWQFIDSQYAYAGNLGPQLHADGSASLKMWSPMVADVQVILYDKVDQDRVIQDAIPMQRGDDGVWILTLNESTTGLSNHRGYFYNYKVDAEGSGLYRLALDPYAPSMAAYNHTLYEIGKGAIIDPSQIGPELSYAAIPDFRSKEDAIIWEIHVRDFTADPSIEADLNARFATFTAMIDKLDYIQSLGVTHVQLLPVMSYRWGDELASGEREMHYSAHGNNYNWGYDPHSYFSVSGMYSDNPEDPERRIEELKLLVDAIHKRGMGVILDVVYNHTADVRIFEDLAPGYYHFMDADGTPRTSFGGGRLGTTHAMSRRILVDSILYWVREFKVDGFRFDMMGDHDAESIQLAYDEAKKLNPNIVMIGEGWKTFAGDAGDPRRPADQDWMQHTSSIAVFSDDFRNELKSGFGHEGEPRFITGGPRDIQQIFDNVRARPHNFIADEPGDVVPYIAAHDNLTLHDVIAYSIQKDPELPEVQEEIHRRIRIGNAMVLTSQGVAFLHAGQEYGRTKQWRAEGKPEHKETYMTDTDGNPFTYPYFVHDSYDSTDIINMFDWQRATDAQSYPLSNLTREYTQGLIALRRSTDAFRLIDYDLVERNVKLLNVPEIAEKDLAIAYSAESTDGEVFVVFVNADTEKRQFTTEHNLSSTTILVDENEAGTEPVGTPSGFSIDGNTITLNALTVVILKL